MGQGGYLWIVHATSKTLSFSSKHSYQMESWDFEDIDANSLKRFHIQFEDRLFTTDTDDAGKVTVQVHNFNSKHGI